MSQKSDAFVYNRVMGEIGETSPQHPGVFLPKKDKILEWTLYNILQQMQEISAAVRSIDIHLRIKSPGA